MKKILKALAHQGTIVKLLAETCKPLLKLILSSVLIRVREAKIVTSPSQRVEVEII
jgi:hypothetical protein